MKNSLTKLHSFFFTAPHGAPNNAQKMKIAMKRGKRKVSADCCERK